jgi:DNA-binding CsgD family transcriptional regulator
MSLRWRAVQEADLEQCLAIDPRSSGDGRIGRAKAATIWRHLLRSTSCNSALVEIEGAATRANGAPGKSRIVSFGASIFLDPDLADRLLRCPEPDINSRIFSRMQAGKRTLRFPESLASQTGQDPLDLLLLCSSFQLSALSPAQQVEVAILLPRTLVHLHIGYPIRRILMETTNERMRLLAVSSGVWKMLAHFPAEERALMAVTREEALGSAGFTILAPLFHHRSPVLGLRDPEKELLCQAMHGETDTALAAQLELSISTIKKRWTSLFARIAAGHPELLPRDCLEPQADSRGSQKRHHILAYVRDHPEELRPFRWYPKQPGS